MPHHPAIERVMVDHDRHGGDVVDLLARATGADLTTLLLKVFELRAASRTPSDVLHQRLSDRFVKPSNINGRTMIDVERRAIESLDTSVDVVVLSPLSPLGTCSVVGGVHQNRVVTTLRRTDVAADPTNALAIEAALRRRALCAGDPRSVDWVKLAAVQRVTRAQVFEGPLSFAHFSVLAIVIAGRDIGDFRFENAALPAMIRSMNDAVLAVGAEDVTVSITDFRTRPDRALIEELGAISPHMTVLSDTTRTAGHGYYPELCFKLAVTINGEQIEVGDGGFVPWTTGLTQSSKERLLIGGIGLDRLAMHMRS